MTAADRYVARVLEQLPASTPRRDQIALELRSHIAERVSGGHAEQDVLQQLGDPRALAESYLDAVPLVPAPFGRRVAAKIIDGAAVFALVAPAGLVAWLLLPDEAAPFALAATFIGTSALFVVYTIAAEVMLGRTLGKALVGLRVVRESGTAIGLGQGIVRQLPLLLQIFLIDALFALFTAAHQRAFELLSRTRVVRGA